MRSPASSCTRSRWSRPCGFLMPQTWSRSASSAISSGDERVARVGRVEQEHGQRASPRPAARTSCAPARRAATAGSTGSSRSRTRCRARWACSHSSTVSAKTWWPTWAITGTRPRTWSATSSCTRLRSASVSAQNSPITPPQKMPSTPERLDVVLDRGGEQVLVHACGRSSSNGVGIAIQRPCTRSRASALASLRRAVLTPALTGAASTADVPAEVERGHLRVARARRSPLPVSSTRPLSITIPWFAMRKPKRTFCSTSRIVLPACVITVDRRRARASAPSGRGRATARRAARACGSSISERANSTMRRWPPDRFPAFSRARSLTTGKSSATSS